MTSWLTNQMTFQTIFNGINAQPVQNLFVSTNGKGLNKLARDVTIYVKLLYSMLKLKLKITKQKVFTSIKICCRKFLSGKYCQNFEILLDTYWQSTFTAFLPGFFICQKPAKLIRQIDDICLTGVAAYQVVIFNE